MSMIQDIKNKNYDGYTVIKSEANPNANPGYSKDIWNAVNDEMGTEKTFNGTGYRSNDPEHRAAVEAEYLKRLAELENPTYDDPVQNDPKPLPQAPTTSSQTSSTQTNQSNNTSNSSPSLPDDYYGGPIDGSFNTTLNQSNTTTNTNTTTVGDGNTIYGDVGNQNNTTTNTQSVRGSQVDVFDPADYGSFLSLDSGLSFDTGSASQAKERSQNYMLNLL